MAGTMTWDDLWCHSDLLNPELERQLDLSNWLRCLSVKVQMEVLKSAPADVIRKLKDSLHPEAYQKLLGEKQQQSFTLPMPTIKWDIQKKRG